MAGISLAQAAKELRRHPATVRRWIAEGCPAVLLGGAGRGRGSRVNLDQVIRWRAGQKMPAVTMPRTDAEILSLVAGALVAAIEEDSAHRRAGIEKAKACGLLALAYQRVWRNLMLRSVDEYVSPPGIARFCAIWLRSIEDR